MWGRGSDGWGQKRKLDPANFTRPTVQLLAVMRQPDIGARNWTQILWKSSGCSYMIIQFSSSHPTTTITIFKRKERVILWNLYIAVLNLDTQPIKTWLFKMPTFRINDKTAANTDRALYAMCPVTPHLLLRFLICGGLNESSPYSLHIWMLCPSR